MADRRRKKCQCAAIFESTRKAFHADVSWDLLPGRLIARGFEVADQGELALFAMWSAPRNVDHHTRGWHGVIDPERRGVIEQCPPSSVRELTDKARLADYLLENGFLDFAPVTMMSKQELSSSSCGQDMDESGVWFLKHVLMARNEGVTVHKNRDACLEAWLAVPEAECGNYLAQQGVPRLLLDQTGRKVTLRLYILIMAHLQHAVPFASAFVRRDFACRVHPDTFDPEDPDPEKHVTSTLGVAGVQYLSGADWAHCASVWPNIRQMMSECLQPFLVSFAASERRVVDGPAGARSLTFDLLGADVVVDADFKPWLLEFNRMPQLAAVPGHTLISSAREAVIEDMLGAVLDQVMKARCLCSAPQDFPEAWDCVAKSCD
ncbi:unnamed protein product [Prorocentrum cordatum]|uniref:Tubulin--tyrosine ligase-like protein 5 n=1 Tax=Prorocentrum cordatum TaxID=2364126 RepID=A0ABN9PN78_9DINO|nr:unnamed protein product [Polarella glacialis]